ncbi:hypothetical protein L7F22_036554 [Adiantum nelumboides]|nr:hypothetical protein [Adiantum nelumboides]
MKIPVWRVVADDCGHGDWTLIESGLLKPASAGAVANDLPCLWNADIKSLVREEFTCSGPHQRSSNADERTNCFPMAKENIQPKPMVLGLLAEKDSEKHLKGFSPKKRGILTENSTLCNGSAAALKRQRVYEAKHADVQPMFQTASSKPVHFSISAMQKAKALLGSDDVGPYTTSGQEECIPSIASLQAAKRVEDVYDNYKLQLKDSSAVRADGQPLFQTASSKPVQISFSAMQKAKALLNFNDIEPYATYGEEQCSSSKGPCKEASTTGSVLGNVKSPNAHVRGTPAKNAMVSASKKVPTAPGKLAPNNDNDLSMFGSIANNAFAYNKSNTSMFLTSQEQPISLSMKQAANVLEVEDGHFPLDELNSSSKASHVELQNPEASSCLFQTATGKAVSISTSGMLRAKKLLVNTETSIDHSSGLNMLHTARGQSVSVSSTTVKQAAKILGEKNFSFAAEGPLSSPPIRFVTAVGKSLSVSSSAMKRAKDLLEGDLEIRTPARLVNEGENNRQQLFETPEGHLIKVSSGSIERAKRLLKEGEINTSFGTRTLPVPKLEVDASKTADIQELHPRTGLKSRHNQSNFPPVSKKSVMPRKFVTSFKAPRRLQPAIHPTSSSHCREAPPETPKYNFSQLVNFHSPHKKVKPVSSLKDVFMQQPHHEKEFRHLTNAIKTMTSETAKTYRFSSNIDGLESIGSDEFRSMLLESGAKSQVATKEWVDNHYRWIVWKLASLERSYPFKVANKLLTIQKVFDELHHRYEREVDCTHRSAIKKITEGDSVAGRMMVLCVAAICTEEKTGIYSQTPFGDSQVAHVEVTDGWYSLVAHLDPPLTRHSKAGKVFIGQKLRVCGATLLGCTTPMPPLEAFQVMKLGLHINGTYRAHWMEKLGFCKGIPMPLAFHCIKPDGGLVPRTIIGINRIYPVLYYERLPNGGSVTRSARAEDLAMRGYHDRRNQVAEDAVIRMERECMPLLPKNGMDEGAKIFQLLENSAEPDLLMADMSTAQHAAFAAFQSKREAARQSLAQKNIIKALGEVHLDAREVIPFMRISVSGLCFSASKTQTCSQSTKGGIVTVWQVTEEQVDGFKEGAVYCVSNLSPSTGRRGAQSRNAVLQLRTTKGSNWQLLPQASFSGFTPRKVLGLSMLGTLPFRSEFDVAVFIIHVGKPYASGFHQRQWVFASDGSLEEEYSKESKQMISLLAIDFSTSIDAFLPVERALEGCVIGYCNLVKRCRDQRNSMWVAEASESSVFSSNLSARNFLHLKAASDSVNMWAKCSEMIIAELEERVHKAVAGGS